jgi:TIR domain
MQMLDVFLSWSGARSQCLAGYLHTFLPTIVPGVRPFYSPAIDPGDIWSNATAAAIRKSRAGILCIARDNLSSPWLQFEAAALWQRLGGASGAISLLLDVSAKELPGTLQLFQTKCFDKKGFKELCEFLGRKARINPTLLRNNFKAVWPGLEDDVRGCLSALEPSGPSATVLNIKEM